MKTKKEILFGLIDKHRKPYKDGTQSITNKLGKLSNHDMTYEAMEEYANQFKVHKLKMKPKIFVGGSKGCWNARFTIGVQTFTLGERCTKQEALWYCKMIRHAFKNLTTNPIDEKHGKSKKSKKNARNSSR